MDSSRLPSRERAESLLKEIIGTNTCRSEVDRVKNFIDCYIRYLELNRFFGYDLKDIQRILDFIYPQ